MMSNHAQHRGSIHAVAIAVPVLLATALGAPPTLEARHTLQQDTVPAAPRDSLAEKIRELEARIDSLIRVLDRLESGADEEETRDELARLREAAEAAARESAPPDTAPSNQSRTRNLQILNPELSVTGDVVGNLTAPAGPEETNVSAVPREFEISLQSALDPYTRTKIFLTREEEFEIAGLEEEEGDEAGIELGSSDFTLEEAYLYWVGLPAGLGLKVGQIRQEIGLYNRWHTHALLEVERPLATTAFLGESLVQTGAGVTLPSFQVGSGTQTMHLEFTRGSNGVLFEGGDEISFLGRFQSFWDLGPASYFQVGGTGLYGENDELGLESRLAQVDLSYRWTPPGKALYRDLRLKAEWYFAEKDLPESDLDGHGGYVQANYRASRRWVVGARADFLSPFGEEPDVVQLVPHVTWWQSEWVRLRLQYNYLDAEDGGGNHTLLFQTVWSVGPHKHEHY